MEQKAAKDEIQIDLGEILGAVLAKAWMIVFVGVVAALAALIFSKFMIAPVYSASTSIYVIQQNQSGSTLTSSDLQTSSLITKDYVELITSRTVLTQAISELGLNMSADGLKGAVSVSSKEETRIIYITVTSTDAYQAQKLANKIREVASVQICSVMNIEAVNVVDEATIPTSPISPNVRKNTMLGGLAGIVLAMAVVVVLFLLDDSIKSADDVEKYLELSVLGSIPVTEEKKKGKHHRGEEELDEVDYDADAVDEDMDETYDDDED